MATSPEIDALTMCIRAAAVAALLSLNGAATAQTADFLQQEGPSLWRASKLPGVAVFGPDKKKVGTITDVLLDHNGRVAAVPFDQVTFTQEPLNSPQAMAAGAATGHAGAAGVPSTTALGAPTGTTSDPNARGPWEPRRG